MDYFQIIKEQLEESADVKRKMISECAEEIAKAATIVVDSLSDGGKVLLCGNGGSAADSQHIAAELVGKLRLQRRPMSAIALTTDTSIITAVGNDFEFDSIFKKQVEAHGNKNDVLIGISTSGNSTNVINAIEVARSLGLKIITLLGGNGGKLKEAGDSSIIIPSSDTQRIQEGHIAAGHLICDLVERELFG